jgi:hypothetical protein
MYENVKLTWQRRHESDKRFLLFSEKESISIDLLISTLPGPLPSNPVELHLPNTFCNFRREGTHEEEKLWLG